MLLDAVIDYLPAPTDVPNIKGTIEGQEEEGERVSREDEKYIKINQRADYLIEKKKEDLSKLMEMNFMNEKNEKFLPIGTVVLLKSEKKRLMITGFCSFDEEKKDKIILRK